MLTVFPLSDYADIHILERKKQEYLTILQEQTNRIFEEKPTIAVDDKNYEETKYYRDFFSYLNILNTYDYHEEWQDLLDDLSQKKRSMREHLSLNDDYHYHSLKILEDPLLTEDEIKDIQEDHEDYLKFTGSLSTEQRALLVEKNKEMVQLSQEYDKKRAQFQKNEVLFVAEEELSDISDDIKQYLIRTDGGFHIQDNQWASYIISHSQSEEVREKIFNFTCPFLSGEYNLEPIVTRMIALRQEIASIYGYATYASVVLEDLMAKNAQNVLNIVESLQEKMLPRILKEQEELKTLATLHDIAWKSHNMGFIYRLYEEQKFNVDQEELRQYFQVEKAVEQLHQWITKHYGVTFEKMEQEVWHSSVQGFNLMKNGKVHGVIYHDLFERPGKTDGAFFSPQKNRCNIRQYNDIPIGILCTNFRNDEHHTMTMYDLKTLWHEYGHALHHLLIESGHPTHSGMYVENDAIELPSTFMEEFISSYEMLSELSGHMKTGEVLPRSLYDTIVNIEKEENFNATYATLRYTYYDLHMHEHKKTPREAWSDALKRFDPTVKNKRYDSMVELPHVFTWGYESKYHSYMWASIMVHDIRHAMQSDPTLFQKYNDHIFTYGAAIPMDELYEKIMGRPMSVDGIVHYFDLESGEEQGMTM